MQFDKRRQWGQVMTPPLVARLMASMVSEIPESAQILDPGAGRGALTEALIDQVIETTRRPKRIHVAAWEIDSALEAPLRATLDRCVSACGTADIAMSYEIRVEDFLASVSYERSLAAHHLPNGRFDIAILNPPYGKVRADSIARAALRDLGVEIPNLYAGFVAASLALLRPDGELVAITPRSFCNGPYFRDFRRFLFDHASIDRIHVFESRTAAFSGDQVLQENVIFHAVRGRDTPKQVLVSSSFGPGSVATVQPVPPAAFVDPDDADLFIHLPGSSAVPDSNSTALADLGVQVSTGKVVDFRARQFLCETPVQDSVPLIYPSALKRGEVVWPPRTTKKAMAILRRDETQKLLVPAGHYVLVRRMSSKEERRRVVAAVISPDTVPASAYAFENHVNYFHEGGAALDATLARGLSAFLNSEHVDGLIRQFNGHTQVNAADLRRLRYPTRDQLMELGAEQH